MVKLGGGLITLKDRPGTVDYEALRGSARQLSKYYSRGGRLVVVHGGGSFGHHIASRLLSAKGALDSRDAVVIQESMLNLAGRVLRALIGEGVPASLHPPHSVCKGPEPAHCDWSFLLRDFSLGLAPLTFGDAVASPRGAHIISGDDISSYLARYLQADCLVYAIRGEGVVGEAGVLRRLASEDQVRVLGSGGADVTGGIVRKVKLALTARRGGVKRVVIVGGTNILGALEGRDVGTLVEVE